MSTSGRSFKKILKISRQAASDCVQPLPKPAWLKVRASVAGGAEDPIRNVLSLYSLSTVCREAACPNRAECFSQGTAAFLILGELCTRRCAFCDLAHGTPKSPDDDEPYRLAQAVKALKLRYAVITSPDRDDLKDGGAKHFAAVISELRKAVEGIKVEILVPDFKKKEAIALKILSETPPDVFNHNIETVPRLYRVARPGASYEGSLSLLRSFANKTRTSPPKVDLCSDWVRPTKMSWRYWVIYAAIRSIGSRSDNIWLPPRHIFPYDGMSALRISSFGTIVPSRWALNRFMRVFLYVRATMPRMTV